MRLKVRPPLFADLSLFASLEKNAYEDPTFAEDAPDTLTSMTTFGVFAAFGLEQMLCWLKNPFYSEFMLNCLNLDFWGFYLILLGEKQLLDEAMDCESRKQDCLSNSLWV